MMASPRTRRVSPFQRRLHQRSGVHPNAGLGTTILNKRRPRRRPHRLRPQHQHQLRRRRATRTRRARANEELIMKRSPGLNRRAFLRGVGVSLALPTLESISPIARALAAPANAPLATTPGGMPLRMGFIAFANGSNYVRW